jgi:hypothetical protein
MQSKTSAACLTCGAVPSGGTYSVNGFGTAFIEARGLVAWDSNMEDSDGILAFCLLGLPVVPYRTLHSSHWQYVDTRGQSPHWEYTWHPIRWSWALVGAAFVRQLWVWIAVAGVFLLVVALIGGRAQQGQGWMEQDHHRLIVTGIGLLVAGLAVAIRLALRAVDRRHQDIRLLPGRHVCGSSDPAYWTEDMLQLLKEPEQAFGTPKFGTAVSSSLSAGDYGRAMFAARLSTALEDRAHGEHETDKILEHPEVQRALERVRKEPRCRNEVLPPTGWEPKELFVTGVEAAD